MIDLFALGFVWVFPVVVVGLVLWRAFRSRSSRP